MAGLNPDRLFARVFIDDLFIAPDHWAEVRPQPGQVVTIRAVPMGSGNTGKDVLRVVAMIAIVAVAAYTGGAATAALVQAGYLTAGSAGALAVSAGITTAISIAGSLALNALVPPPRQRLADLSGVAGEVSPALSITGTRNQMTPYGPIPRVFGRHRLFPPLGARPYTEVVGNDQYLRLLFCLGYGPLTITDLRIGSTPLETFSDVQTEIRYGYATDPPLTLFTNTVLEDALSIKLTNSAGWQVRTSQPDADELSVDITFPAGLVRFDAHGSQSSATVQVDLQFRKVGDPGWTSVETPAVKASLETDLAGVNNDLRFEAATPGSAGNNISIAYVDFGYDPGNVQVSVYGQSISVVVRHGMTTAAQVKAALEASPEAMALITVALKAGNDGTGVVSAFSGYLSGGKDAIPALLVTDRRPSQVRRSVRWKVPTRGQYEVRLQRATMDHADTLVRDEVFWTALRTIRSTSPTTLSGLAWVAMRIKATDQLNGVIDQFNCIAESILPDWNGFAWVERPTRNPASIYRHILQGPANARPVADARIDLATLEAWHDECAAAGREFNAVIDFRTTVFQLLNDVAAIGRASFGMRDGKYSVVRDVAQSQPVQHFTPRNSWGFRGTKNFLDLPHALKVRFINPEKDWQQDERIVYDDGYNADGSGGLTAATKFEVLDLFGVTSSDLAWKLGRYHLAVARLRPELYELHTDIENLVCTRGDLVRVTHDIPLWGLGWARIKTVTVDGSGNATAVTIDEVFAMEAGKNYSIRIRRRDGSSVVQQITTVAGEQTSLTFTTAIPAASAPAVGDLVMFGELGSESVECLVKSIEPGQDFTAKLTLVDYAPAVLSADGGPIPPFNSQITSPPLIQVQRPEQPIVDQIRLDESTLVRLESGAITSQFLVSVRYGQGGLVATDSIQVRWRPSASTGQWTVQSFILPGEAGEVAIGPIQVGVSYDVQVRAVSDLGQTSDWVTRSGIVPTVETPAPPRVTGLELVGQGNTTIFVGRDAKFQWRDRSRTSGFGSEPLGEEALGFGSGAKDPWFRNYRVEIYNTDGITLRRREYVVDPFFTYTFEKNAEDAARIKGSVVRDFVIKVWQQDIFNNLSPVPAVLQVSNPVPQPPGNLVAQGIGAAVQVKFDPSAEIDIAGYRIHRSTTNGFTPDASNLVYDGPDTNVWFDDVVKDATYYFRVAAYDTFGKENLLYSSQVSATVTGFDPAQILGTISALKLNTGSIQVVGVTWTNNSPSAGSVAWAGAKVVLDGVTYSITDGNTSAKWIYWTKGNTTFSTSATTFPVLTNNDYIVAWNDGGTLKTLWNNPLRAGVITGDLVAASNLITAAAQIVDGIITNAKIASLDAAKITTGFLDAARLNTATAYITAAAQIANAIISNAHITDLSADKLNAGTLAAARLSTAIAYITNAAQIANAVITNAHVNDLSADKLNAGTLAAARLSTAIAYITAAAQISNAVITNAHLGTAIIQTANIVDLNVTSLKIANNAVTNRAEARVDGNVNAPDQNWVDIVTVNVTTSGGSVVVIARTHIAGSGSSPCSQVQLVRDPPGIVIDGPITQGFLSGEPRRLMVLMDLDAPSAGTYTYKLQGRVCDFQTGPSSFMFSALLVTEYLK